MAAVTSVRGTAELTAAEENKSPSVPQAVKDQGLFFLGYDVYDIVAWLAGQPSQHL